jgi:HNH endonuclease
MINYIISPEFVQLVEEHPQYFLALAAFGLFAILFVSVGLYLCIQAIPRPNRIAYHYYWPQVARAEKNPAAESAPPTADAAAKPWEAASTKRWEESLKRPSPDTSSFRKYSRVPIPKDARLRILRRDKFRCQLCGRAPDEVSLHVDHKMPLAAGGTNDDANLWTLCSDCNLAKSDKIMEELFDDFVLMGGPAKKGKRVNNVPETVPIEDGIDDELTEEESV